MHFSDTHSGPKASTADEVMDLEERIGEALRESHFPKAHNGLFASKNALKAVTDSSVAHTIWPDSPSMDLDNSDKELIEFVTRHAREIFAIGIHLDIQNKRLREMMRLFMMHGKSDKSLPLSNAEMEKIWPGARFVSRRHNFGKKQHLFRPTVFTLERRFTVVAVLPNDVLPIVKSKSMSRGQFGIVYRVTLDKDFLEFNDPIRKVRRCDTTDLVLHGVLVLSLNAKSAETCICHLSGARKGKRQSTNTES